MITLYGFGPCFGLPDPSPYVTKTMAQLKMAGLAYRVDTAGYGRAPKGKLPYIDDAGEIVADSTFIRAHVERKYSFDFDAGLGPRERAEAWAIERMLEDHLYWAAVHFRWIDPVNFAKGPAHFFDDAPDAVRDTVRREAQDRVRQVLHGQGIGRHSREEITLLGTRSLAALSMCLGGKPYLMGPKPCGTDATAMAMIAAITAPFFETPLRDAAAAFPNLAAYGDRMMAEFFPEHLRQPAEQLAAIA